VSLAIALLPACAHVSPYYRNGQQRLVPSVADAEIDHRLLLLGDAGDPDPAGEPALQLLAARVRQLPARTTVLFLGDNVYQRGMPAPVPPEDAAKEKVAEQAAAAADALIVNVFDSRKDAERRIDAQIDVVRYTPARAIFIPGNHDWDQFELGGWDRILNLENYINRVAVDGNANVALMPSGGCPGPTATPLGRNGTLIALDTQWWLETREDGKPTLSHNPTHCPHPSEGEAREEIGAALKTAAAEHRWAIVAGHHPLLTKGSHGGFVDVWTHLFPFRVLRHYVPFYVEWIPLPGIGSLVATLRSCCSFSPQDMSSRRNRHMRKSVLQPMIEAVRTDTEPLVYAAGHDHSLQVFEGPRGTQFSLVSGMGCGSHASSVGSTSHTLFADSNAARPGLMEVDFLKGKGVRLAVIERTPEHPDGVEVYSRFLVGDPAAARD